MDLFLPSLGFGLVTASIIALAAVGFTLQFGVTDLINLAYGDVMTASAMVAYLCNNGAGLNIAGYLSRSGPRSAPSPRWP